MIAIYCLFKSTGSYLLNLPPYMCYILITTQQEFQALAMRTFSRPTTWRLCILFGSEIFMLSCRLCLRTVYICVLRVCYDPLKLIFINVYLSHEHGQSNSGEFSLQPSIIDNIVEQTQDCEVLLGGDLNVDLSRNWSHTCLLNDFCSSINLYPVIRHTCSNVDDTHHFNMSRFTVLDHFIVSGGLFYTTISSFYYVHSADNTFDHEPIS